MRGWWFSKWFIAAGLLLPLWGYLSLNAYASSESFVWNAFNQQVRASFLPNENILLCLQHSLRGLIAAPMGFPLEARPPGCLQPRDIPYINVLALAAFLMFIGAYSLFRPVSSHDPFVERLRKSKALGSSATPLEPEPQSQSPLSERDWRG